MKQREVHRWVAYVEGGTPTRMRSNAVGGDSYFMLGVGGCNYNASTGLPPGLEVGGLEV